LAAIVPGTDGRSPVATPSAQQSALAAYLDRWRRRVERVGTANFPEQFLGNLSHGRPTLEVMINVDGRLGDIVIRRSSGDRALDQAALKILSLAAPFEPLPEHLAAEYHALRFAYEWDFHGGVAQQAAADTGAAGVGLESRRARARRAPAPPRAARPLLLRERLPSTEPDGSLMRSLADHFLIAMPAMGDPNFNETVTYVCKHDSSGALGIIVNRPTDMLLDEVFRQLSLEPVDPR